MITAKKARKILHHGKVRGRKLTNKQRGFMGARARGVPPKKNPSLVIVGNPGRKRRAKTNGGKRAKAKGAAARARKNPAGAGTIISDSVTELRYIRRGDGQRYFHPFKPGVRLVAQADGSLRLYSPVGLPLWKDFPS